MKLILILLLLPTIVCAQSYYHYVRPPHSDLYIGGVESRQYKQDMNDYTNQQWWDAQQERYATEHRDYQRYLKSQEYTDPWGYRKQLQQEDE